MQLHIWVWKWIDHKLNSFLLERCPLVKFHYNRSRQTEWQKELQRNCLVVRLMYVHNHVRDNVRCVVAMETAAMETRNGSYCSFFFSSPSWSSFSSSSSWSSSSSLFNNAMFIPVPGERNAASALWDTTRSVWDITSSTFLRVQEWLSEWASTVEQAIEWAVRANEQMEERMA